MKRWQWADMDYEHLGTARSRYKKNMPTQRRWLWTVTKGFALMAWIYGWTISSFTCINWCRSEGYWWRSGRVHWQIGFTIIFASRRSERLMRIVFFYVIKSMIVIIICYIFCSYFAFAVFLNWIGQLSLIITMNFSRRIWLFNFFFRKKERNQRSWKKYYFWESQ